MPGDNGDGTLETLDESAEVDEESDLRILVGEDGVEVPCLLLVVIEHEGQEFALLSPVAEVESEQDEMEVYVLHYEKVDGEERFSEIEDQATYDEVVAFASTLFESTPGGEE